VGLSAWKRVPVREGTPLVDAHGHRLGGHQRHAGPTSTAIAMAYLPVDHAAAQHEVYAEVRGKRLPMRVTPMPFTPTATTAF
jgi:aminomethyltransferase